jgi:hypothetical protein
VSRPRVARRFSAFSLAVLIAVALPPVTRAAPPVTEITRPELKSIATPGYFADSGIQLTEAIANDLATLKVDMVRTEFIGENDATKSICYTAYDRIVDRLAARQIKVLGLLDYQSITWGSGADWATDDFRNRFVARVQEIVGHYATRANPVRHWEIWNEEDICVTGYCPRVDPEPFGRILVDVYHAIKAIDPGATVVLGGISPKGFEYSTNYLSDLYATAALQAHYSQYGYHPFDVVGAHPYAEVFTAPNPGLTNVLDTKVKAVMNANGDAAKKVWLTEMGWNTSQVTATNQSTYLKDSYLMLDTHADPAYPANGPYVERYFWFCYKDWGTSDLWGLKTASLAAKPSYTSYKNLGPSSVTKPTPPPEDFSIPGLTRESAASALLLATQPDPADPLNGKVATRISGGFHSINTDPAGHEPAFTDGAGLDASPAGLLVDVPGQNTPAWSGFWVLDAGRRVDLREVRVFSGSPGKDGRVFHHYDLYATADPAPSASSTWTRVREQVTSAAFGASNVAGSMEAMDTRLGDPGGGNLAAGITAMRLDFYSVSAFDALFHDDWDNCNGNDCDGAAAAFLSPRIYEVDAYFVSANQPPVLAAIGNRTVNEAATLTFTVSATDPDSGNLAYSASNLPSGATFDPASRTFSWTPGYDQAGSYPGVVFTVSDGSATDSETITIAVSDVNRAPVLAAIGNQSVNEAATLSFTVSATDADGDTLTYSASNLPSGATFTPATRTFSWTPGYTEAGSYPGVVFSVGDGKTSASETITLTVNDVNRAPVLAAIGSQSVNEAATLSFTVSATDADGDTLTYSASNLPSGATFDAATRTFLWTPAYNQAGSYPDVVFTVSDGKATDSETITVTVNDVNAPPVLAGIGDRSVNEGATLTFTVSATDPDGDSLTYAATNLPAGASFDPGTRTFSWIPRYDQAGMYANVSFEVSDDGAPSRSDSETIAVTVVDVNRPPVLGAVGDQSVLEGDTLSFTVSATDPDGDTLTYSASNLPSGASFTPATRTFSWTPTYDQAGTYPAVVFTVADAQAIDSESITIAVTDNPSTRGFYTVVPCRVLDTRSADGPYGGPALVAGADRTFTVAGQCGIPAAADAVSVNLTVTGATAAGNLRLYPAGIPLPLVSTVNYIAGATRGNNAIVPLNALGEMAVRCAQASGTAHFILDVNGYFQADARE